MPEVLVPVVTSLDPVRVPYTTDDVTGREGTSGLTMCSTFSGAGGSTLGYRLAGFKVLWANEFDPDAAAMYRLNMKPDTILDERGIRAIDFHELREQLGEVDLFEGSPPCSKFSTSGKRSESWGQVTGSDSPIKQDRVEDLFFDWIEAVKVMRPKIAVAENVTGLTIGPARGYLIEILERLRDAGYNTKVWKLDASLFGAPTRRTRIFVVGTRLDGFPVMPVPSTPTPITAGEATADLQDDLIVRYPPMRGETDEVVWENNWAPLLRPEWAICKKAKQMRPGTSHADRFSLMRLHPDKPAPVLDTVGGPSSAGFVHWDKQLRRFSIEELARLQGFPDHYNFGHPVSYPTKVARLGNSVPPPLAAAVVTSIRNYLTANTP